MQYRDLEFRYDADDTLEPDSEYTRQMASKKQYSQKRKPQLKRRKSAKSSHPGCGMGARRNHRWSW